jgi:hypothetical protein
MNYIVEHRHYTAEKGPESKSFIGPFDTWLAANEYANSLKHGVWTIYLLTPNTLNQ